MEVLEREQQSADLDIIFVSLDLLADRAKAASFIRENKMPGVQFLLDDVKRSNEWIPQVYPDWQGNIPATAFYRGGKQLGFYPKQLSKDELATIIDNLKK